MRSEDLGCLTGKSFNENLKTLLVMDVDYKGGKITSHSIGTRIATEMACRGHSDEEMMRVGRRNSLAFIRYCKLERELRWRESIARTDNILKPPV